MGVTDWLSRLACQRPHLLVAEAPGGRRQRFEVERIVRERGWALADGPADADLLVVCGPAQSELADAVEVAWLAMAVPRARVELAGHAAVGPALDRAVGHLGDLAAQRADAAARAAGPPPAVHPDDAEMPGDVMDGMEHGAMGGMEHGGQVGDAQTPGDMDHAEMGHDMGGMDMDMDLPGGLAMADRAPDRDGLKLDVLHLRLGPLLPCWPAGLVLDVALQGDVVQSATAGVVGQPTAQCVPAGPQRAAAHLDSVGRLLELSGWQAAADTARRLRDDLLTGQADATGARLEQLRARVRRSRSLRWSLRDLGVLRAEQASGLGIAGPAQRADGDVRDRLLQWLDEAQEHLDGARTEEQPCDAAVIAALPQLVEGLELAGVRLVVASLDPDVTGAVPALSPTGHQGGGQHGGAGQRSGHGAGHGAGHG